MYTKTHIKKEKAEQCPICNIYTVRTFCGIVMPENSDSLSDIPTCGRCQQSILAQSKLLKKV